MSRLISCAETAAAYLKHQDTIFERTFSLAFRLHTRFTSAAIALATLLLMATEFFGAPIQCISKLPKKIVNTFCWISGTFTMEDHWMRKQGINSAAPGIYTPEEYSEESEDHVKYHNYYQWVVIYLPLVACCFYLPMVLWKKFENNLLAAITAKLSTMKARHLGTSREDQKEFVEYFVTHMSTTTSYFWAYLFCEVLCFINVFLQAKFMDHFLGGEFSQYGTRVLAFTDQDQDQRIDPMIHVFPRTTKCTFNKFGTSGTIEKVDNYCILAQNIFNEKVFVFLWFWFAALVCVLGITVLLRVLIVSSEVVRAKMLHTRCRSIPRDRIEMLCNRMSVGDWWMLYNVASFVEPKSFNGCLASIWNEIQPTAEETSPVRKRNNSGEVLYQTSRV